MREVATETFIDCETLDEGCFVVRAGKESIGLAISLRQDGDIEVFLNVGDCQRLIEALKAAVVAM